MSRIMVQTKSTSVDRGWAWLVLLGSFLNQFIIYGTVFTYGVYYVVLLEDLDGGRPLTACVGSVAVAFVFGMGPLSSILGQRFGTRAVVIASGVVSSLGLALGSLATNTYHLLVTFGVITGGAYGIAFTTSYTLVSSYFLKWRFFALSVAAAGVGVGTLVMGRVVQLLIDEYTWRGSLLISSAISLNMCVMGALQRPFNKVSTQGVDFKQFLPMLHDMRIYVFWASAVLFNYSAGTVMVLVPKYLTTQRISFDKAALSISMWGLMNSLARVVGGVIVQHPRIRAFYLYWIALALGALFMILLVIEGLTWHFYAAFMGLYGVCFGLQIGNLGNTFVEVFGVENLSNVLGWVLVFHGVGYLAGPPISGWLVGKYDSFRVPFYLSGTLQAIAAILLLAVPILKGTPRSDHQIERDTGPSFEIVASEENEHN